MNNRLIRRATTPLSVLLLTGCAAVGPDFKADQGHQPAAYAMIGDSAPPSGRISIDASPAGAWWTALRSPDLDRVVRQALVDSPNLAAADAALDQARQAAFAARGGLGPEGGVNAGAERTRINIAAFGLSGFPSPTVNQYSIGGTVSYDLDLFGGRRRQVEGAQARAEAEGRRAAAAYLSLTGNVALQAVQIAGLRAQITAANEIIAEDQRSIDLAGRAIRAGAAAPSARTSLSAQLLEDQAELPGLNQQLGEARHALAMLVGHAPADWAAPDFDIDQFQVPTAIPLELPSELVHRRPDILAAEAEVHAATAEIGAESAKLYPDIRLNAAFTQTALTPDKIFDYAFSGWNAGPNLSVPIFGRAALKANQRRAEAAARQAVAQYQQTVLQAFVQVADALEALANDGQSSAAEASALEVARKDLANARFAFERGGGNLVEVSQAQRRLAEIQRAYAVAQTRQLADVVKLYVATGSDWRETQTAAR